MENNKVLDMCSLTDHVCSLLTAQKTKFSFLSHIGTVLMCTKSTLSALLWSHSYTQYLYFGLWPNHQNNLAGNPRSSCSSWCVCTCVSNCTRSLLFKSVCFLVFILCMCGPLSYHWITSDKYRQMSSSL